MKILKKIYVFVTAILLIWCTCNLSFGFQWWTQHNPVASTENIKPLEWQKDIWNWSKYLWWKDWKLVWILIPDKPENYDTSLWYAMQLIQIIINWLLWILAFVSLIYMLYCGYLIFSSWADEWSAKKWKAWIKTSAIALAWIGLSWLIISAMIWFVQNVTK